MFSERRVILLGNVVFSVGRSWRNEAHFTVQGEKFHVLHLPCTSRAWCKINLPLTSRRLSHWNSLNKTLNAANVLLKPLPAAEGSNSSAKEPCRQDFQEETEVIRFPISQHPEFYPLNSKIKISYEGLYQFSPKHSNASNRLSWSERILLLLIALFHRK